MPIQIMPITSGNFSHIVSKHGPDMPSLDTLLSQDRKCTEDTAIYRIAAITPDGEIVGFGFAVTGVSRPYRGKGLSFAAKVKAAEFAKNQGAKYLRTHNDSNNERILAVNRKMGYKPKPGIFFLTRRS